MTLFELMTMIREYETAEHEVEEAKKALDFGGNDETVLRKERNLSHAQSDLRALGKTKIELGDLE